MKRGFAVLLAVVLLLGGALPAVAQTTETNADQLPRPFVLLGVVRAIDTQAGTITVAAHFYFPPRLMNLRPVVLHYDRSTHFINYDDESTPALSASIDGVHVGELILAIGAVRANREHYARIIIYNLPFPRPATEPPTPTPTAMPE